MSSLKFRRGARVLVNDRVVDCVRRYIGRAGVVRGFVRHEQPHERYYLVDLDHGPQLMLLARELDAEG